MGVAVARTMLEAVYRSNSRSADRPSLARDLAICALARGEPIILHDEARGTADLLSLPELVVGETIAFMAIHGRGLTTLALPAARVDLLRLPPMVRGWGHAGSATVSIEARHGVSTGISAHDRARTIRVAVAPAAGPGDLISPGHVFPLRVDEEQVGPRRGRGEVALALARAAGFGRGAVLCEILDETGERADADYLSKLATRWSINLLTVAEAGF